MYPHLILLSYWIRLSSALYDTKYTTSLKVLSWLLCLSSSAQLGHLPVKYGYHNTSGYSTTVSVTRIIMDRSVSLPAFTLSKHPGCCNVWTTRSKTRSPCGTPIANGCEIHSRERAHCVLDGLTHSSTFGLIPFSYGINAFRSQVSAAQVFFLSPYQSSASAELNPLVAPTMTLYAIRAMYMGASLLIATYFGHRKTLGALMLALSCISLVDGYVVQNYGDYVVESGNGREGPFGHWIWGPPCALVGVLLLGVLDG